MKQPHFEDGLLESTWQGLEFEFKSAGMAEPQPGFTNRWQHRLAQHQEAQGRRQTWFVFIANLVIAFGFLSLMGLRIFPEFTHFGQFINLWVNLFARVVVFFKMIISLLETLSRTLPSIVPPRWWFSLFGSIGVMILLWVSIIRQQVQIEGALE